MAAIQRRQGKWDESSASYAKAVSLDPKDPILLENMGMNYLAVRDYPAAERIFDRARRPHRRLSRFASSGPGSIFMRKAI